MKAISLVVVVLFITFDGSNSFKIRDTQFLANSQSNLFDNDIDDLLYQQTLEKLAKAAEESQEGYYNNNEDSAEDYYSLSPEDYDEIRNNHRDMESPSHSSVSEGFHYIQGGNGEEQEHFNSDGSHHTISEAKSDDDLPAYCNPPNPCPIGYKGQQDECDPRPFKEFTAEYSKYYQASQDCMCDDDHNDCSNHLHKKSSDEYTQIIKNLQMNKNDSEFSAVVAKKSPRSKRSTHQRVKSHMKVPNPYLRGEPIKLHVAKKSVHA